MYFGQGVLDYSWDDSFIFRPLFPRGIQPLSGPYWGTNRASVTTMSSCGSASSVAEEPESRDQSASSSSIDGGRKQLAKVAPKNNMKGKDSPWIVRPNNGPPVDAR